MSITDTIRERLGVDIAAFAGTHLAGDIPITDEFINQQIAQRLAGHPHIAALQVQSEDGDTVGIHVVPRVRLLPPMRIVARIERQPEFPEQPLLLLRWSMPTAGRLATFAAPLLSYFKAMPSGIRMDGDRITVDIGELLRSKGFAEALSFVRRLVVHTRPGGLIVQIDLGI